MVFLRSPGRGGGVFPSPFGVRGLKLSAQQPLGTNTTSFRPLSGYGLGKALSLTGLMKTGSCFRPLSG